MTITISKFKVAAAVLAVVLLAPATAFAAHVFADVPDGAFYADPVEWAFDNAITTGKSPTSFAPLDDVTRGESVTFLKRYDDNIVQPALAELANSGAELANSGMVSVQETTPADPVAIDSTSDVLIDSVTVGGTGTVDVVLTAHVQIENDASALAGGRFGIKLRLGDCDGEIVGAAGLRAGASSSTFVGSTTTVTGFADDAAAGSTFALCVDKDLPGGADGVAYRRGIVAIWS